MLLKTLLNNLSKRGTSTAESRWKKRVSARVLGGKIKDFKNWLGTDAGQMSLIGTFVVLMLIAGAAEKVFGS